jgi:hypothetical protein
VRNPFRTEAEAYRFLLFTIAGFAVIAVASKLGGAWAGVPVTVAVAAAFVQLYFRRGEGAAPARTVPPGHATAIERRILVVANETVGGRRLREELRKRAEGFDEQVLVVCPASSSPGGHPTAGEDAGAEAQRRLEASLERLSAAGVNVRGEVGDSDPLRAIADALRGFGADEVIISTHPEGRSTWLEGGVVAAARERFTVPITHVVVDLEREREVVR